MRVKASQPKVSLRKKLAHFICELIVYIILLEIGLRAGGTVFVALQDYRNSAARQKERYRIMCVGESTTALGGAFSYPSQLEEILNQHNIGIKFSVINAGVPTCTTNFILSQLERNIATYRPDMVVTMMGAGDDAEKGKGTLTPKVFSFLSDLRTYKLAKLLWQKAAVNVKAGVLFREHRRVRSEGPRTGETTVLRSEATLKKAVALNPDNDDAYFALGMLYKQQGAYPQAEEAFRKAIELNPAHREAYLALARLYYAYGHYPQAEEVLKKVITLHLATDRIYIALGRIYSDRGEYAQAEAAFKKAVELDPARGHRGYIELAWCYSRQSKYAQAEAAFRKAVGLDLESDDAYIALARFYGQQNKYAPAEAILKEALASSLASDKTYVALAQLYNSRGNYSEVEPLLKKAVALNPDNDDAYFALGMLYKQQGAYPQAEKAFARAFGLNPNNYATCIELGDMYYTGGRYDQAAAVFRKALGLTYYLSVEVYEKLGMAYEAAGRYKDAQECHDAAQKLKSQSPHFLPVTAVNYQKLKKILDSKKIKLVCVQYPLCKLESLKRMFEGQKDCPVLVDNEKIFKDALAQNNYNYREYFIDLVKGDFGHCTDKGNRLLAENIATAVLREVSRQ